MNHSMLERKSPMTTSQNQRLSPVLPLKIGLKAVVEGRFKAELVGKKKGKGHPGYTPAFGTSKSGAARDVS
jgi:hypothetical protein